jgi:hypothetical protein
VFAQLDGRVEETERLAEQALAIGRRADAGDARSTHAARLLLLRRQQGRLAELLPEIRDVAKDTGLPAWEAGLALAEIEAGDTASGRARLTELVAGGGRRVPRDWYWLPAMAYLADVAAAVEDAGAAAALYAQLAPYADRTVQLSIMACWGSLHRQLGLLAAVAGRPATAERHFEAALVRNQGAVLLEAETQCAYAALLAREGEAERAAALAARAEAVAAERGLEGLRRRARRVQGG